MVLRGERAASGPWDIRVVNCSFCVYGVVDMSFRITTTQEFAASHQLRLYDGSLESLHGHNWKVTVTVGAAELDEIGLVMDFHVLDRRLERILRELHNHHLNEVEMFGGRNPSAENVALTIAENLRLPRKVELVSVEVWETEGNSAVYVPEAGE